MKFAIRAGDQWYDHSKNLFHIVMDITERCPYKCSYCYESNTAKREISFDNFCLAIDNIKQIKSIVLPSRFVFFGGEPTCHPLFLDMVHHIKQSLPNTTLCATSNAYKGLSFLKDLYDIDMNFNLNYSVHFEHINDNEALEKIAYLTFANAKNVVNILYLPSMRKRVQNFFYAALPLFCNKKHLIIKFLRSKESHFINNLSDYTSADYVFLNNYSIALTRLFIDYKYGVNYYRKMYNFGEAIQGFPNEFYNMFCTYPMSRLRIKIDGTAFSASCYNLNKSNIFRETFDIIENPVRCIAKKCVCADQRRAAKFTDWKFAPQYLSGIKEFSYKVFPHITI